MKHTGISERYSNQLAVREQLQRSNIPEQEISKILSTKRTVALMRSMFNELASLKEAKTELLFRVDQLSFELRQKKAIIEKSCLSSRSAYRDKKNK